MKITETLTRSMVLPNLGATNKVDCLMEMATAISSSYPDLRADDIAHVLLEREKLGSTGIQDGIAIPHGKIKTLHQMITLFGRSSHGIDFQAHDNKPTQLFFVLLAPEESTTTHLKLLARLSRLLKNQELRDKLLQANDADTIFQTLCEEDEKIV